MSREERELDLLRLKRLFFYIAEGNAAKVADALSLRPSLFLRANAVRLWAKYYTEQYLYIRLCVDLWCRGWLKMDKDVVEGTMSPSAAVPHIFLTHAFFLSLSPLLTGYRKPPHGHHLRLQIQKL